MSVVIPTRNRAALVKDAIESVLAVQHANFELEVIVVDDGSTDETPSVVSQYPVTYLHTPGGLGCAGARNVGITAAHGDFIAFLDDDDVWLPTNITPQLELFATNPTYGAVHAQVILTGPDRTLWDPPPLGSQPTSGWIFQDLLGYWAQCASIVYRRSVIQSVGPYDATLRDGEDWDLMLRIARRYPIGRVEQPVALFRQRCDNNEVQEYSRMPDTIKVFHRHTRKEPLWRRFLLQRLLWRHRGWYAANFLTFAQAHAQEGEAGRALSSLRYALIASPLHMLTQAPRICTIGGHIVTHRLWNGRTSASFPK